MLQALPDLKAMDGSTIDAMDESSQDKDDDQIWENDDLEGDSQDSDSPRSLSTTASGEVVHSMARNDSASKSSSGSTPSRKTGSVSALTAISETDEDADSSSDAKKIDRLKLGLSMAEVMDVKLKMVDRESTVADVLCQGMVVAILLRQFG
jgi:hypothetical protein